VLRVVGQEERRFLQTLTRGLSIFEDIARRAQEKNTVIEGSDAFLLYDTHGFPLELTTELAQERGLEVDREGFSRELEDQRVRARQGQKFRHDVEAPREVWTKLVEQVAPSAFTGYDELQTTTEIVGIVAGGQQIPRIERGDQVEFVLATTPFYAESGGQVGDTGAIRSDSGLARVLDTQRPVPSLIVHKAEILEGTFSAGDVVKAEVDEERRLHILPHHSGTHLLHKALQEVLGPDATQAGSLVAPDRLRFDFRWPSPLTAEQIREVQDRVNAAIWANLPVRAQVESYDIAIKEGAMALFGEKYSDRVRVVSMGEWSKELCGGTHVAATGDIGLLVITSETGIGSGVRRIEALAGAAAYAYINDLRDQLHEIAEVLEAGQGNVIGRAQHIVIELREQERRLASLTTRLAKMEAESLVRGSFSVNGFSVVANRISADSVDFLHATTDAVKSRLDRGIVVLATVVEGKPAFSMAVTGDLKGEGFEANAILREAARRAGGGAGGNAEFAQGGGKDASKVDDVLETAVNLIKRTAEA
jgi:alanyl-tRNA synthetase